MLLACCTSSFVPTAFQDGSPAVRVVKACNLVANVNAGCTPEAFPPADDTSDGPPSDPPPSTVTTGSSTMSSSVVSPSLATSSSLLSTSDVGFFTYLFFFIVKGIPRHHHPSPFPLYLPFQRPHWHRPQHRLAIPPAAPLPPHW